MAQRIPPYLVCDIETVRDESVAWTPRSDAKDPFPPPPAWEVVCIGVMLLSPDFVPVRLGCINGETEAEQLRAFTDYVLKVSPTLVTFNGRRFDCPVIEARSAKHWIAPTWAYEKAFRKRYEEAGHLDLADFLSNGGASNNTPLDTWCSAMGFPGKGEVHGSDVGEMVKAGRIGEVRTYCLGDVMNTALLLVRSEFARGRLAEASARQAEAQILTASAERMAA